LVVAAALVAAGAGCSKRDDGSAKPTATGDSSSSVPAIKRKAERLQTAVPYGKHVDCHDLFPLEEFASRAQLDLGEIRDAGKTDSSATSVCLFHRAGKAPAGKEQKRKLAAGGDRLGVMPGDEYCMVRVYCSLYEDSDEFLAKCEQRREQADDKLGFPLCVRVTMAGERDRYSYKAFDPDTRCRIEVSGGPSVTGEEVVKRCTTAAVDIINTERLAKYH
jgi:hypothetical protein